MESDSYSGAERRREDRSYDGPDRRVDEQIRGLVEKVDRLEGKVDRLEDKVDQLEGKVDRIAGQQEVLLALTRGINGKTDRLSSVKTLLAIVLPVVGSILAALVGGYFVLKTGAPTVVK